MPDILIQNGGFYQSTSSPTIFYDQLVTGSEYQSTSQACVIDLTAPTFSGIVSLINGGRGQMRAAWAAGTDVTLPVRYEVYCKALTNSGLFSSINLVAITDKLQYDIFTLADGSFIQANTTYFVGIKAIDGVGNRDNNLVTLSIISTGLSIFADTYEVDGAFAINPSNELQGTLWALKNSNLAVPSSVNMGIANYQIYDKDGTAIVGMNESNIAVDSNGQYKITPIASNLNKTLDHYMIKITMVLDGAIREGYTTLVQPIPEYDVEGTFILNTASQLTGSFWASADEEVLNNPSRLGTGAYQVYDGTGSAVVGMTQSGIIADSNGLYEITPIASSLNLDLNNYYVKVTVTIDSVLRNYFLPILGKIPKYESKAVFSINGANQLQATIWAVGDNLVVSGARLGTANFTVYDSSGVAVAGLTQSGITADVNGRFITAPVSATLLTDLTHYTVKVGVVVDGLERVSYKGFTLLGN
jgi:hypothetical protein